MSTAKHTPGPWTADQFSTVCTPEGQQVAMVCGTFGMHTQARNATLIAAAPTLLSALQELAEQNRLLREALDEAIDFATDQSPKVRAWSVAYRDSLKSGTQARAAIAAATGSAQ